MSIIDVQVHIYERNHPGRPWVGPSYAGPEHVTGDEMVAAMEAVGVDGAILVSPLAQYGFDASYALEVHAKHPGKFGLVKPVDTTDPAVVEVVTDWAETDGAVGIRVITNLAATRDASDPGFNHTLAAAARHSLPVNMMLWGQHALASGFIARNPDTIIVIDHLGIIQPFHPPVPPEPWADLPKVLELAKYDNVRIKISGACTLSQQGYPYDDIWDPILRIIDAYGLDRCMWGSDWTRATEFLSYQQAVESFQKTSRLTESDRASLMGRTVEQVYGWSPT